jgi:hypothetical protein
MPACDEHRDALATTKANAAGERSATRGGAEQSVQTAARRVFSARQQTEWVPPPLEDPAFSAVVVAWLSAAGASPELDRYRHDGG